MSPSIKKTAKKIVSLGVAVMMLEGAGYLYGLQPSDIVYHYTSYSSDIKKIKSLYSINVRNGVSQGEHKEHIIGLPVENKYESSRFFHIVSNEIEKIPPLLPNKT